MLHEKIPGEKIKALEKESLEYQNNLYRLGLVELDFVNEAAEDCVQETYLNFEQAIKIRNYPIRKCKNWLFKVMYDNTKRMIKAKNYARNYLIGYDDDPDVDQKENRTKLSCAFDSSVNIPIDYEKFEKEKSLLSKINQLDKKDKRLVIDIYFKNKKLARIAKEQGCTIDKIKKRHRRIKTELYNSCKDDVLITDGGVAK